MPEQLPTEQYLLDSYLREIEHYIRILEHIQTSDIHKKGHLQGLLINHKEYIESGKPVMPYKRIYIEKALHSAIDWIRTQAYRQKEAAN